MHMTDFLPEEVLKTDITSMSEFGADTYGAGEVQTEEFDSQIEKANLNAINKEYIDISVLGTGISNKMVADHLLRVSGLASKKIDENLPKLQEHETNHLINSFGKVQSLKTVRRHWGRWESQRSPRPSRALVQLVYRVLEQRQTGARNERKNAAVDGEYVLPGVLSDRALRNLRRELATKVRYILATEAYFLAEEGRAELEFSIACKATGLDSYFSSLFIREFFIPARDASKFLSELGSYLFEVSESGVLKGDWGRLLQKRDQLVLRVATQKGIAPSVKSNVTVLKNASDG